VVRGRVGIVLGVPGPSDPYVHGGALRRLGMTTAGDGVRDPNLTSIWAGYRTTA